MGKKITLIFVFLIVLSPASSIAFRNEPDGFRGLEWGTHISKLPQMHLFFEKSVDQIYERKNDRLKIGYADLNKIFYIGHKGRLYGVSIFYEGITNYHALKEVLFELHGEGNRPNQSREKYNWRGIHVNIKLEYSEISNKGTIKYTYKPIAEQRDKDEELKAKEAAGDL